MLCINLTDVSGSRVDPCCTPHHLAERKQIRFDTVRKKINQQINVCNKNLFVMFISLHLNTFLVNRKAQT